MTTKAGKSIANKVSDTTGNTATAEAESVTEFGVDGKIMLAKDYLAGYEDITQGYSHFDITKFAAGTTILSKLWKIYFLWP